MSSDSAAAIALSRFVPGNSAGKGSLRALSLFGLGSRPHYLKLGPLYGEGRLNPARGTPVKSRPE